MAKRKFNLQTRNGRRSVPVGAKLHVSPLIEGLAIGYRKGKRGGSWFARRHEGGIKYSYEPLGTADDAVEADGIEVLTCDQAKERAEQWFRRKNQEEAGRVVVDEKYTVADAMGDYLKEKNREKPKAQYTAEQVMNAHILPSSLAKIPLSKLNHDHVKRWRDALLEAAPRNRTRKGQPQAFRKIDTSDPDVMRKRRSTVNRIFTVMRAGLNFAHEEGRVANKAAWERIKPFRKVDVPRVEWLTLEEAKRVVAYCADSDFRQIVQGGLITAARYEELCLMKVGDFNAETEQVFIPFSKNGEARYIDLKPEDVAFFTELTHGRPLNEFMFLRADGDAWSESEQKRRIDEAVKAAGIAKHAPFHVATRHTWATNAARAGVPLQTIMYRLGHKDIRTTMRHYAHHCPSHSRDQIRAKGPSFAFGAADKVIPFPKTGTAS